MTVDTKIPTFVVIKSDDGKPVDLKAADDLAAEMLIKAFVPEYFDGLVTFNEAYDLALRRDEEAAHALEMSAEQCDAVPDLSVDLATLAEINTAFEDAALADRMEEADRL